MNSKVWLTVYGIFAVLLVGGSGFYAISSHGKYSEALESWDSKVGTIGSLERRVPYPNEPNAEALKEKVEVYKASVTDLSNTLQSFQRELNTTLANTDFQQHVKRKVEEFRASADQGGLTIEAEEFQLGFDRYANTVPAPRLVPVLDYELEAIDRLLRKLISCGVKTLVSLERDAIPGEEGGPEADTGGVVQKYPVRLRFRGSHDSFQKLINELANDRQFFYIVRVLKVKNEVVEGPSKLVEGGGGFEKWENPTTKEVATAEMVAQWKAEGGDVAAKASAAGFIKADQDARVLMGQENLSVFLVVDIARFLNRSEVEASRPEPQPEARKGRR